MKSYYVDVFFIVTNVKDKEEAMEVINKILKPITMDAPSNVLVESVGEPDEIMFPDDVL